MKDILTATYTKLNSGTQNTCIVQSRKQKTAGADPHRFTPMHVHRSRAQVHLLKCTGQILRFNLISSRYDLSCWKRRKTPFLPSFFLSTYHLWYFIEIKSLPGEVDFSRHDASVPVASRIHASTIFAFTLYCAQRHYLQPTFRPFHLHSVSPCVRFSLDVYVY